MVLAAAPFPPSESGPERDDAELVGRVRAGDVDAFERIFIRYGAPLAAYARSQLGSREAAEDLIQELFLSLWDRRATWVVRGGLRSYLFQATRNRILNARRDERTRARVGVLGADAAMRKAQDPVPADQTLSERELQQLLDRVVDEFPPKNREVYLLVKGRGLSHAEVAEVLGISVDSVAAHMRRALQALRTALAEYR